MNIAQDTVALIEYKLTNDGGEVIDSSEGGPPLAYLHGHGNLIPGLEAELTGKAAGDAFSVRIEAANAYGERNDEAVHTVPRSDLPQDVEITVGMQLQAESEHGVHILTVAAIEGDQVQLDANHPLAGQALNFDVKVVDVRAASEEELQHGHVHGEGGHEH